MIKLTKCGFKNKYQLGFTALDYFLKLQAFSTSAESTDKLGSDLTV